MTKPKLKALRSSASTNRNLYRYNQPNIELLETFKSPFFKSPFLSKTVVGTVHIEVPEFTSLCPITGQPDFAKIVIDYEPKLLCVESKSLKLYMMGFRMFGEFHESCVERICTDLLVKLLPKSIKVQGQFVPRGGIPFWPTAEWHE